MKIARVLELLKIERECVTRQSPCNEKSKLCDRNCGECDIAQNDLELIEMYDFVISMIETLIGRSQWISVKDRLPDAAGYECLVCAVNENYNQTHVFTAHTGYGEPGWWTGNVHYMSRVTSPSDNRLHPALNVTHWMPLPEPPKEVTQDD